MNIWKTEVQPVETAKPTRLRRFYEREPDKTPPVAPAAHEPAQVAPSPDTLEAGSWEQPVVVPVAREVAPPGDRRKGKRPYTRGPKNKIRRHSVSISVSEEEEDLLRIHAAKLDMSFSAWARVVLFRALGRKMPKRLADEAEDE
jgi:hypothetical protein